MGAHRKVVTVLFCDVVGSTALGESVDPEALQGLLARYFERMKSIVESHGGSVEKFIGDAVMAVFGVPVAHEDDAIRACRAAVEMRDALPELGVAGRIGVNSGEVLTGTEERLATGDAVNVAARLEQAAQPGEVLVGAGTLALASPAVEVGGERLLELKGKREPVPAYPLVAVREGGERPHTARFVGRERELEQLFEAWDRALSGPGCELVTVAGDPGVGKSRLVAEVLERIDAPVVRGRCLSYGEGITYWPVVEVVKQLGSLPGDELAAKAIRSLLGEYTVAGTDEIAWAFRKLLEEQAPLVVCFDDIQWGEETFLELIESTALLAMGAPLLLLCMARPELFDRRPSWSATLRLAPLPEKETGALVGDAVPDEVRERIVRASGGNPLFVTEMVAFAGEGGDVEVPATLRALLAARLDQLDEAERKLLERGAVEGELFHRGTVRALSPEETEVTPRLAALVRRDLLRPDRAMLPGEDAYRFRHLLIRDAAYDALPKAIRAELHERFVDWLEERGAELVELDEILGYHLEQAHRYRHELGEPPESLQLLRERAGERLSSAARRARHRGDLAATVNLLRRASALSSADRLELELELGETLLYAGQPAEAELLLDECVRRAVAQRDRLAEVRARVVKAGVAAHIDPVARTAELLTTAEEAIPIFEANADQAGLMRAWTLIVDYEHNRCHWEARFEALEKAGTYAVLAGEEQKEQEFQARQAVSYMNGPWSVEIALAWFHEHAALETRNPVMLSQRAALEAMRGNFDDARTLLDQGKQRLTELGHRTYLVLQTEREWQIEMLAGEPVAAARRIRWGCEMLEQMGERSWLSTAAAELAQALLALGAVDEAAEWAKKSDDFGASDDVVTQMLWRQASAKVCAARGEDGPAERHAQQAVALAESTDGLNHHADALMDLAQVFETQGKHGKAAEPLSQALDLYTRKGNLVMEDRARTRLATVTRGPTTIT